MLTFYGPHAQNCVVCVCFASAIVQRSAYSIDDDPVLICLRVCSFVFMCSNAPELSRIESIR